MVVAWLLCCACFRWFGLVVGFVGCVWVVCYLVLICGQAAVLVVCGYFYLRLLLVWLGDWHCSFASCFVYRFLFRGWFVLVIVLLVWVVLISMLCLVVCML